MKHLLAFALACLAVAAQAAPTLSADPYPSTGPQPTSVTLTVNGSPGPACTLVAGTGGSLTPRCDLAALAVPGTYTLVMTAVTTGGCTQPTSPATCTQAGSASSVPFSLSLQGASATRPVVRVAP